MSDTKTKIDWQKIADTQMAANQLIWESGRDGLFAFLTSVPVPSGYYCNSENCSGHTLEGTDLEPLTKSGKFSYYQNGNGFALTSAASAVYTDTEGVERRVDFSTTINAMVSVIPVCSSSAIPIINIYKDSDGWPSKVTVSTRKAADTDTDQEKGDEVSGKVKKKSRRRSRN